MDNISEQEYKRRMRLLLGNRWHKIGKLGACEGFRLVAFPSTHGFDSHGACEGCPDCSDYVELLEEIGRA